MLATTLDEINHEACPADIGACVVQGQTNRRRYDLPPEPTGPAPMPPDKGRSRLIG